MANVYSTGKSDFRKIPNKNKMYKPENGHYFIATKRKRM
jgi:hypothetical protein